MNFSSRKIFSLLSATAVLLVLGAQAANASMITNQFQFLNASNSIVASGTFSYDASLSGNLGYANLSAFDLAIGAHHYDLGYVDTVATNYKYFDYNTTSNSFVPGLANGYAGTFGALLSAVQGNGVTGFFFDPLATQTPPNNDGALCTYPGCTAPYTVATSVTISPVPEPATLALFGAGLIGLAGFAAWRKKQLL